MYAMLRVSLSFPLFGLVSWAFIVIGILHLRGWEDLDTVRYVTPEGEEGPIDAAEEFFGIIDTHFSSRLHI